MTLVITPLRLTLSTSCSMSSSIKTLNGWSGNSSISARGMSLILLNAASARLSSVSKMSSYAVSSIPVLLLLANLCYLLSKLEYSRKLTALENTVVSKRSVFSLPPLFSEFFYTISLFFIRNFSNPY